jgi:hypothetical protein
MPPARMPVNHDSLALTSAISSRREHTPQAPHSPKTPAPTPPKHHQHPLKHTPTLTTETHTTNATPHLQPNTTPHRDFSALHPHTPRDPITRHLLPIARAEFTIAPLLQVPPALRGEPRTGSVPPARRGNLKEGGFNRACFCKLWSPRLVSTPRTPTHATLRSPLSKPQHGFSPNPKPLFIQRNPTSTSQRCHTFNNNCFNGTGNCHPSVPSETACTQNAIGARDLPRLVRLECPRTIITKNTRSPHPIRRHGPSTFTRKCTLRPRTTSGARRQPARCCHLSCGVHTWSLYTRRRPRPEGAPCGRAHQRESLRVRTQQTVCGTSSVPNAWVVASPVAHTQQ